MSQQLSAAVHDAKRLFGARNGPRQLRHVLLALARGKKKPRGREVSVTRLNRQSCLVLSLLRRTSWRSRRSARSSSSAIEVPKIKPNSVRETATSDCLFPRKQQRTHRTALAPRAPALETAGAASSCRAPRRLASAPTCDLESEDT